VFDHSDLDALNKSSHIAVDALVGKCLEVNGFKKVDEKKDSPPTGDSG
jgi:hypothetical protein